MAEGSSKKKSSKSKGSSSKAASPASKQDQYAKLLAARRAMEEAQADVLEAELAAKRAYAYQGDFRARDRAYAEAQAALNAARERASRATTAFQVMKMGKK